MSSTHKISLQSAILMNLNIMAGAGIFVNIVELTRELGVFSGFLYLAVGLFMFPLVFMFALLVEQCPSGSFYAFAKPISPFVGFVSAWAYFFGKLASASFLLHVAATFLQKLLPYILGSVDLVHIDLAILALFVYLNVLNVRIGLIIQRCFFAAKFIPLVSLIALGICFFDINLLADATPVSMSQFIVMLPLVLYCYSGFEAACSVSRNIVNASVNAPKAIFQSFFSIIAVYFVFQTVIACLLMPTVATLSSYAQAFPFLMSFVPVAPLIQVKLATALSFMIGFSAMGAAYGLLFSNAWNLYALAEHGHVPGSSQVLKLNKHGIATYAVLVEGLICVLFILVTKGAKIPLQQTATLGCALTYTISSIAFLFLPARSRLIGYLSLLTCSGFIAACVFSAIQYKFTSLLLFVTLLAVGLLMYWKTSKR